MYVIKPHKRIEMRIARTERLSSSRFPQLILLYSFLTSLQATVGDVIFVFVKIPHSPKYLKKAMVGN